jgi:4-amino-4-deoxy-L-arabinose transferase-like glycosyltransferase
MLPFYVIFRGDPIAGTVFQTTLSLATIPLLYLMGKKVKNETVGLFSAFLFAISPLMIDFSRAAFNAYPAVFFSTLILYLYLTLIDKFTPVRGITVGVLIGFVIQMHYLAMSLLLLVLLYPVIFHRKLINLTYYASIGGGVVLGLSPFLLFELKHQFLNVNLMAKYFLSDKETEKSLINAVTD